MMPFDVAVLPFDVEFQYFLDLIKKILMVSFETNRMIPKKFEGDLVPGKTVSKGFYAGILGRPKTRKSAFFELFEMIFGP